MASARPSSSSDTINLQVTTDDGKCDLNFVHHCDGPEMAFLAKQFAALVAGGGSVTPASAQAAQAKEHRVGKKIGASAFDRPSVVFARATRSAPKMETEIGGRAAKVADGSVHSAIFGEDEEDYEAAVADMQLGNFTPTAYDYSSLRH